MLVFAWHSDLAFHLLPIWLQTLLLIQNQVRDRFQAFTPLHLKWLCCLMEIRAESADALFLGHVSTYSDLDLLLCTGLDLD